MDCCKEDEKIKNIDNMTKMEGNKINEKNKGIWQGIAYGIIPHIGCIAFIVGSVLGVTVLTQLFKPLLMNRYFFYILMLISLGFATLSSVLYLRKNSILSFVGIKRKWKYLSVMYGSTIGVNLLLFLLIFPLLANMSTASNQVTGAITSLDNQNFLKLKVDIPCSGHAPLISGELKSINGVLDVQFSFPNNFNVRYDPVKTSKQQILSLEVFKSYPATVLKESNSKQEAQKINSQTPQLDNAPQLNSQVGCSCGSSSGCGFK